MAGAREEILAAFRRLERRSGRRVFQLRDVVAEVLSVTNAYNETTLRTYITSVMCADAPVHHANHTNDLSRVGHGLYALSGTGEVPVPNDPARMPVVTSATEQTSTEPANPCGIGREMFRRRS
jgi:hypothetical protein